MNMTGKIKCPNCEIGEMEPTVTTYLAHLPKGKKLPIENVALEVCDHCGEDLLPLKSAKFIDQEIEKYKKGAIE